MQTEDINNKIQYADATQKLHRFHARQDTMNIKPYQLRKRFYNNEKDSIVRRVVQTIKTCWHITKQRIFSRKQTTEQNTDRSIHSWMVTTPPPASSIEPLISWLGHATFLLQLDGINIITDPIFFNIMRSFRRLAPMPFAPEQLPKIDYILLSHNHHDHLDVQTLKLLVPHKPTILAPKGHAWLKKIGFNHVIEKTWGETETITTPNNQKLTLTFLPAEHWSGRGIFDLNRALWGSWMIHGSKTTIYFAGDTSYARHFTEIGKHYPNILVALES